MGNEEKEIASLQARMNSVEKDIEEIKDEQMKTRDELKKSAKESTEMAGEIKVIKGMLEDMSKRKMRGVDVAIALGVLISGSIGAYASIRMIELTKIMVELSKNIK
jgi:septal ring factor EnvC (AmiA/AmiB activator)